MDIKVSMARPRERDSTFVYYENLILDRVLNRDASETELLQSRKLTYSI